MPNCRCHAADSLPRGPRGANGKADRVILPWEARPKYLTQEFEAFALTPMREMPVKRDGRILSESASRMWAMLFAHVKAAS